MTSETTTIRDLNAKHGLVKRINLHYNAILGATLHKEDTGKDNRDLARMFDISDNYSKASRSS